MAAKDKHIFAPSPSGGTSGVKATKIQAAVSKTYPIPVQNFIKLRSAVSDEMRPQQIDRQTDR